MIKAVHFVGSFYQIGGMIIDVSQITCISPDYTTSGVFVLLKGSVEEFRLDPSYRDPIKDALLEYQTKLSTVDRVTSCN